MDGDSTAVVIPFAEAKKPKANAAFSGETVTTKIIQGVFVSESDRDAFLQAITTHGITFLRCANTELPNPSAADLSAIEKLARAVSLLWSPPVTTGEQNG